MEYKRLGDYIREVNVRNSDLEITNPMGINIDKYFMPSVANVIGTDLSTYKLVSKNQFACNLMHVGRDERIPMALHTGDTPIIVSPAYFVFEIIHNEILLPSYLMIWFRRPEFDRNAWFYTDADVRGGLSKEAFLDMRLPIPSIEEQQKNVAEYQAVEQRIENNNRLIKALEDTAQAIYHHTFVENIDPENLPEGWRVESIGKFCDIFTGKKDVNQSLPVGKYRFFSCSPDYYYSNEYIAKGPATLIVGNGSYTGRVSYYDKEFDLYQRTYACLTKKGYEELYAFLHCVLLFQFQPKYMGGSRGTSIPYIVRGNIEDFPVLYNEEFCQIFSKRIKVVFEYILLLQNENEKMNNLQLILLSKLS